MEKHWQRRICSSSVCLLACCCCCMSVPASFSDGIAGHRKRWDAPRELHQGRPGLGTPPRPPRTQTGIWLYTDSWYKHLSPEGRGTNPALKKSTRNARETHFTPQDDIHKINKRIKDMILNRKCTFSWCVNEGWLTRARVGSTHPGVALCSAAAHSSWW